MFSAITMPAKQIGINRCRLTSYISIPYNQIPGNTLYPIHALYVYDKTALYFLSMEAKHDD
jgi:hypothetical protein